MIAFVALGSNLANPQANVLKAIEHLQKFSDLPLSKSSLWQTTPVDCPPASPPFVNAVVGLVVRGSETPESLLLKLLTLEKQFGRRSKKVLNEPRPLDLDLLAFGEERRATEQLILPHPRAHLRRFVLQPLEQIAPDLVLPGQDLSIRELLKGLPDDPTMMRLNP